MKLQLEFPDSTVSLMRGVARHHEQALGEWLHQRLIESLRSDLEAAGDDYHRHPPAYRKPRPRRRKGGAS